MYDDTDQTRAGRLELAPDPYGEVLHRRGAKILYFIEKAVVKAVPCYLERALQLAEVNHHPSTRVGSAAHDHLGAIGMAVDAATGLRIDLAVKRVSGVKSKLLAEFEHQRIPIILCDWSDRRQRGLSVQ